MIDEDEALEKSFGGLDGYDEEELKKRLEEMDWDDLCDDDWETDWEDDE